MKMSREEWAAVLRMACEHERIDPWYFEQQADAVMQKLAELEKEQPNEVAQAELAAYVAACKAMCSVCDLSAPGCLCGSVNCRAGGIVEDLVIPWHKRHDASLKEDLPPKCRHSQTMKTAYEVDGTYWLRCADCGMLRSFSFLGDWEKPDASEKTL